MDVSAAIRAVSSSPKVSGFGAGLFEHAENMLTKMISADKKKRSVKTQIAEDGNSL